MKNVKLFLIAAVAALSVTMQATAQTADEILDKHMQSMGGTEKWNNVKSMKITGSISAQGMEMNMTQTILKGKGMRMDMNVMGMNGYVILTPTAGWMCMPPNTDTIMPLPTAMLEGAKDQFDNINKFALDKSQLSKTQFVGMDTVNSVGCYKVKVTDKKGNESTCYFDAATYYMIRVESTATVNGEEQEIAMNYGNFQKQPQGVVFPMLLGTPQGDMTVKTVEINNSVDESIFIPTKPAKSSAPAMPGN